MFLSAMFLILDSVLANTASHNKFCKPLCMINVLPPLLPSINSVEPGICRSQTKMVLLVFLMDIEVVPMHCPI